MAPAEPKNIHLHILYTVSATGDPNPSTTFARSSRPVAVKPQRHLKGQEKWGKCELGEVVRSVCAMNPDLLPTSSFDHNVFIHNPKLTFSEQKRTGSSTTAIKPIEDQLGLLGWALDRKGEKSQETVMGFWRKEEVEEGTEGGSVDGDDEELEEWLEVRVRFVKTKAVSYEQHLSAFHSYETGTRPKLSSSSSTIPTPSASTSASSSVTAPPPPPLPPTPPTQTSTSHLPSSSSSRPAHPENRSCSRTHPSSHPSSSTRPQSHSDADSSSRSHHPHASHPSSSNAPPHPSSSNAPYASRSSYPFDPPNASLSLAKKPRPGVESQLFHALPPSETSSSRGGRKKKKAVEGEAKPASEMGSVKGKGKERQVEPQSSAHPSSSGASSSRRRSRAQASAQSPTNTSVSSILSTGLPFPTNDTVPPPDPAPPDPSFLLADTSNNPAAPLEFTPELVHLLTTLHRTEDLSKDQETARLVRALLDAAENANVIPNSSNAEASSSISSSNPPNLLRTESAPAHLGEPSSSSGKQALLPPFPPLASLHHSASTSALHLPRRSSSVAVSVDLKGKGREDSMMAGSYDGSEDGGSEAGEERKAKRKYAEFRDSNGDVEGCANCGRKKATAWRKKKDGGRVCNACGIYWNKFKSKRPPNLWGDLESSPARRKTRRTSQAPTTSPARSSPLHSASKSKKKLSMMAMTSPLRGKESWGGGFGFGGGFGGAFGAKLVGVASEGGGDSDDEQGEEAKKTANRTPPRDHTSSIRAPTTPNQLPSPFRVGSGFKLTPRSPAKNHHPHSTLGFPSRSPGRTFRHHVGGGIRHSPKKLHLAGGLGGVGKNESPRTALKMHLREGREVKLRRLKGPLSDDEGGECGREGEGSHGHSRSSSGPGGSGSAGDGGEGEIPAEPWMSSEDFSSLLANLHQHSQPEISSSTHPRHHHHHHHHPDPSSSHTADINPFNPPPPPSPATSRNLAELFDSFPRSLSPSTLSQHSLSSSYHTTSQYSSPLSGSLPYDFSGLPPSSPPVIPAGLFSSPDSFSGGSRSGSVRTSGTGDLDGLVEGLDFPSPIFSILSATPTGEGPSPQLQHAQPQPLPPPPPPPFHHHNSPADRRRSSTNNALDSSSAAPPHSNSSSYPMSSTDEAASFALMDRFLTSPSGTASQETLEAFDAFRRLFPSPSRHPLSETHYPAVPGGGGRGRGRRKGFEEEEEQEQEQEEEEGDRTITELDGSRGERKQGVS